MTAVTTNGLKSKKTTDGYKLIPENFGGRVVNVYADTVTSGKKVVLYDDSNNSTQWWKFGKVGSAYAIFNVQNPNVCLTLNTSENKVYVCTYTGASNQLWYLEPATSTVNFNANGGSGSMASVAQSHHTYFTIPECKFTKSGYTFAGWQLYRSSDGYWFYYGKGWQPESSEYTKNVYQPNTKWYFDSSWYGDVTLVAVWKQDAHSHTWNSGVITTQPTYSSTGIKTYTCTQCKATKTETIAKLTLANVTGGKTSSTTNNSVILLWNKVTNATGYKIYTYNASTKKYSVYKTVTTNSASIGGLLAGTRYDFYVKAYVGTNSNYITSNGYHIIKVMTKPANISGLSYTATTSSVTLKWNKVAKVTGYKIYTYNASTKTYSVYKIVSTNSVTLTGLSAGSRYDFYVKAYRTSGSFTAASKDYQIIRVMTNPANVSGLTYTATTSSVTLKWNKVARATGYKIYTYNSSTGKYTCLKTVTTNTATITGLKSKVGNTYYVKAYRTFNSASYFSPNYSQIFVKTK